MLLPEVVTAEPDTHDMRYDSGQIVSVYTGMIADCRQKATAYNNWLILAQRTGDASCKIYLWISNGVDARIRKTIAIHAGDSRAALTVISEMFKKPNCILQRRLNARFFSGRFDAGKESNVLVSQFNDFQTKINSM